MVAQKIQHGRRIRRQHVMFAHLFHKSFMFGVEFRYLFLKVFNKDGGDHRPLSQSGCFLKKVMSRNLGGESCGGAMPGAYPEFVKSLKKCSQFLSSSGLLLFPFNA